VLACYPRIGSLEQLLVIGALAAFLACAVGVLVLRRTQPDLERGFHTPLSPLVPILAVLSTLWLGLNLTMETWRNFAVWSLIGLLFYLGYGRWHSVLARHPDGSEPEPVYGGRHVR
jgi:APA family basic amino acid/polyamine antiporter